MRPSRLTARSTALLLAAAAATLTAGGCQAPGPSGGTAATPDPTLPMRPAWQAFLDENYRGAVLADLSDTGRETADFPPPRFIASRPPGGGPVELLAVGDVHAKTPTGVAYARTYTLLWHQRGGGWELVDKQITPPVNYDAPATPQPKGGGTPTSKPATAPQ